MNGIQLVSGRRPASRPFPRRARGWALPSGLVLLAVVAQVPADALRAQEAYVRIIEPVEWRDGRAHAVVPGRAIMVRGVAYHPAGIERILINGEPALLTPDPPLTAFEKVVTAGTELTEVSVQVLPRASEGIVRTYSVAHAAGTYPTPPTQLPLAAPVEGVVPVPPGAVVAQRRMTVGAKGGLALASLAGTGAPTEIERSTGAAAGVFLRFDATPTISLQPELLFVPKGASFKGSWFGLPTSGELLLTYIEIPVLVRVGLPVNGAGLKPVLFAGPAISFNRSARATSSTLGFDRERDVEDQTKDLDFGAVAGAGLDYRFLGGVLSLDLRYNLGLVTLDDSGDGEDVKNRAFMFMMGFGIPMRGIR
jgi:hypothetical protein